MLKLENNWKQKTLVNLVKLEVANSESDTKLVAKINQLREIPLENFTTEDLRIMIGQNVSLNYLIPLALEILTEDLFAEGDFFEGDLLKNILSLPTTYWQENREYWEVLNELISDRKAEIISRNFDLLKFESIGKKGNL